MNVSQKEEKRAPINQEIGDYYADTTCLQGDMVNLYLINHHEKVFSCYFVDSIDYS